ncbi:MAG: hypothetical protein U0575_04235 [Phycisphaerales bacterium]
MPLFNSNGKSFWTVGFGGRAKERLRMARKPKYLPRFNDPSVIFALDPGRLHALLLPHAAFLAAHGVALDPDPRRFDHPAVAAVSIVILAPHDDTPYELVDALTHIDEMATPEGMERLLNAAAAAHITLRPGVDRSPADLALEVWTANPELLRRQHAEHVVLRRRALLSYGPLPDAPRIRPTNLTGPLAQLERVIRAWYFDQGRGDDATVIPFESNRELRVVIRHGGPYQRKGCLQDGAPGTVQFRPMEFAHFVLRWDLLELGINCGLKGELQMIRKAVGECVFGNPGYFATDQKYTLEPLRQGRVSLRCADVPGLRRVTLVSLTRDKGGSQHRRDITTADDVFQALEDDGEVISPVTDLEVATLLFDFSDSKKPRPVTVRGGNRATYVRDGDSDIVERFLAARGFMREGASVAALATA